MSHNVSPQTSTSALTCSGTAPPELLGRAIGAMRTGFALFDSSDCLQAFNGAYSAIMAKLGASSAVGMNWKGISESIITAGKVRDFGSEWVSVHTSKRGKFSKVFKVPGGRTWHVAECLIDDGGFITIWTDLTDAVRLTQAKAKSELKEENVKARFTQRQREVLAFLTKGMTMKEAARALRLSPRAIAFHKYTAMRTNGLRSSAELIVLAIQEGVCDRSVE